MDQKLILLLSVGLTIAVTILGVMIEYCRRQKKKHPKPYIIPYKKLPPLVFEEREEDELFIIP